VCVVNTYIMYYTILIINGIYDIICTISILYGNNIFSHLHTSLFCIPIEDTSKRVLAFFILTYGTIRLYAGLRRTNELRLLATLSYIIEYMFVLQEVQIYNTMHRNEAYFVMMSCMLFANYMTPTKMI